MLRVMTEKLGNLGYPFDGHLSRQATNWASEMREVSNKHAHQGRVQPAETYRALDSLNCFSARSARTRKRSGSRRASRRAVGIGRWSRRPPASLAAERCASRATGLRNSLLPPLSRQFRLLRLRCPPHRTRAAAVPAHPPPTARSGQPTATATPPASASSARLSLDAVTELSYAMAHARIVPVQEVRVSYAGPELRGASLEIEASTAGGSLGAQGRDPRPRARSQDAHGARPASLDPGPMLKVDTEQPASSLSPCADRTVR